MSNGKAKVAARLRKRGLLKWTEREHRELRKPNIVSLSQPRIRLSMQFTVAVTTLIALFAPSVVNASPATGVRIHIRYLL